MSIHLYTKPCARRKRDFGTLPCYRHSCVSFMCCKDVTIDAEGQLMDGRVRNKGVTTKPTYSVCGSRRLFDPGRQRCHCLSSRHAPELVHPAVSPCCSRLVKVAPGHESVGEAHHSFAVPARHIGAWKARVLYPLFQKGKEVVGMCLAY